MMWEVFNRDTGIVVAECESRDAADEEADRIKRKWAHASETFAQRHVLDVRPAAVPEENG